MEWFSDGLLNASENCIDVHLVDKGDQLAFIWEGDEPDQIETITYKAKIMNIKCITKYRAVLGITPAIQRIRFFASENARKWQTHFV